MIIVYRLIDFFVEDVEVGIVGFVYYFWGGGFSGVSGVS